MAASVAEMLALAEHQGNINNPIPKIVDNAIGGYMAGRETGRKAGKSQLDSILKIMEITDKVQKSKIEAQQQELNMDMMKAFGFLPMGDTEHKASLGAMWDMAGDGKNPKYVNTPQSKLAKMANDMEILPGWSSKNGVSFRMRPKKSATASAQDVRNQEASDKEDATYGEKMARKEMWAKVSKTEDPAILASKGITEKTVHVPDSVVAKYIQKNKKYGRSLANAARKGDTETYKKMMAEIENGRPPVPTPQAINMGNVMTQKMNLLNQAATLDSSINENKKAQGSIWDSYKDDDEETDDEE